MAWYFYLGIIAAICIAIFSLPQLIFILKTKNTSGISLIMLIILIFGSFCFVVSAIGTLSVKGIKLHDRLSSGLPVLIGNILSLIFASLNAFFKIRNIIWARKLNITEKTLVNNYKQCKEKIDALKKDKINEKRIETENEL